MAGIANGQEGPPERITRPENEKKELELLRIRGYLETMPVGYARRLAELLRNHAEMHAILNNGGGAAAVPGPAPIDNPDDAGA